VELAVIYYNANFNDIALSSFCSVNEFIDCDGVAKTGEAQFFGVPLALWGMFLYLFMFFMLGVDKLKGKIKILEVFKHPLDYIATLGIISFALSILLLCVSLFDIKKLCILCALTYVINLAIALTAGGFIKAFKQSFQDFVDGVKKYPVAFICVVTVAAVTLTYTTISNILTPQVKRINQYKEFTQAKSNKYKVSGNILGSETPLVTVYVYSDYRCPICAAHNIMIHKIAKELGNIQVVHRNLPLDRDCNVYLQFQMHEGACMLARYELAAEKQGKLWDINTLFFDKKPKDEAEVLKLAKGLGLDVNKLEEDAHSIEVMQKLSAEIDEAYKKGINGTPAIVIGDNVYIGIKPYPEFKKIILENMPGGK